MEHPPVGSSSNIHGAVRGQNLEGNRTGQLPPHCVLNPGHPGLLRGLRRGRGQQFRLPFSWAAWVSHAAPDLHPAAGAEFGLCTRSPLTFCLRTQDESGDILVSVSGVTEFEAY